MGVRCALLGPSPRGPSERLGNLLRRMSRFASILAPSELLGPPRESGLDHLSRHAAAGGVLHDAVCRRGQRSRIRGVPDRFSHGGIEASDLVLVVGPRLEELGQ